MSPNPATRLLQGAHRERVARSAAPGGGQARPAAILRPALLGPSGLSGERYAISNDWDSRLGGRPSEPTPRLQTRAARTDQQPASRDSEARDNLLGRLLSALLSLVFTVLVLVLPPIVNKQLASDEKLIERPLVGAVVALVLVAFAAWRKRFAVAVAVVCAIVAAVQLTNYLVTTGPSRDAAAQTADWINVPLADAYRHIIPTNQPDVFGEATVEWSGSTVTLKLRSKTGTTQQGIYQLPPVGTTGIYFAATITNAAGGSAVTCPLLFGITNIRNYFTFRIQNGPSDTPEAVAYQIIANSGTFTSGFHALLLGQDVDIPYYDTWNIVQPSANSHTTLAILIEGRFGQFFVDGRRVFQREIDYLPNYTVAIGTTVLANNLQDAANCTFSNVIFRAKPSS